MYKILFILFITLFIVVIAEAGYVFYVQSPSHTSPLKLLTNTPSSSPSPTLSPNTKNQLVSIRDFEKKLQKEGSILSITYQNNKRIIVYKFILKKFEEKEGPGDRYGVSGNVKQIWFYYKTPAGNSYESDFPLFGPVEIYQMVEGKKVLLSPSDLQPGDTILVTATVDLDKHTIGSVDTKIQKL